MHSPTLANCNDCALIADVEAIGIDLHVAATYRLTEALAQAE
jgi:hypothetical protein